MEKMTNKKALEFVLSLEEVKANVEVCEKLTKMLVQVEKKSGAKSDKPSKAQVENEQIKLEILGAMAQIGQPCQIKEICAIVGLSSQKVSALVKQLLEVGAVTRTEVKKVALFSPVVPEEVEIEYSEEEEISEE